MAQHTQGDWEVARIDCGSRDDEIVTEVNGCLVNIASVCGEMSYMEATIDGKNEPHYEVSSAEAAANARLIAAAPKLLASLCRIVDLYGVSGILAYDEAKAIIAEVTGDR